MIALDGHEDALIGVCYRFGWEEPILAYSVPKIIESLMARDKLTEEEAREFYEFNIIGAWVGDSTPVFIDENICVSLE